MKDGTTHLAYKPEHAVDLDTGVIVAAPIHPADEGDTTTLPGTLEAAARNLAAVGLAPTPEAPCAVVGDKGYHSNQSLVDLEAVGLRSYISEPDRGRRNWTKNPTARDAVYRNRRRIRGPRGLRLLRLRATRRGNGQPCRRCDREPCAGSRPVRSCHAVSPGMMWKSSFDPGAERSGIACGAPSAMRMATGQ